ncbi:hypothetical protein BC826DRAFT_976205 [Russula brevipes]|nr:hypothetical protein BC826DRAFT_976205 [Russula brevipes]
MGGPCHLQLQRHQPRRSPAVTDFISRRCSSGREGNNVAPSAASVPPRWFFPSWHPELPWSPAPESATPSTAGSGMGTGTPAVQSCRICLNPGGPGPDFAFPPPPDIEALLTSDDPPPSPLPPDATAATTDVSARTWRPLCERYGEFMEEQWVLDRLEEEQAHAEAAQRAVSVQAEAEKSASASENAHRPM